MYVCGCEKKMIFGREISFLVDTTANDQDFPDLFFKFFQTFKLWESRPQYSMPRRIATPMLDMI